MALFPRVAWLYGGDEADSQEKELWLAELRVCDPERFDSYFRYVVDPSGVSQAQLQEFVTRVLSGSAHEAIESFISNGRDLALFRELRLRKDLIPESCTSELVKSIMDLGDSISRAVSTESATTALWSAMSLCDDLLELLPDEHVRFEILLNAGAAAVHTLSFQVLLAAGILRNARIAKKQNRQLSTLTTEHAEQLVRAASEKVIQWIEDKRFFSEQPLQRNREGIEIIGIVRREFKADVGKTIELAVRDDASAFAALAIMTYSPENEAQSVADAQFVIDIVGRNTVEANLPALKEQTGILHGDDREAIQYFIEVCEGRTEPREMHDLLHGFVQKS